MKRFLSAAAAAALLCSGVASAQDEGEGPRWVPVEAFACHYKDGHGPEAIGEIIDGFNEFADEQGVTDYFATVLTPQYYGERNFDFVWLGAWTDGNAMGADTDNWIANGGETAAEIFQKIKCSSHQNFASTQIKAGPDSDDDEEDTTWVLEFANCGIRDGKSYEDVMGGINAWAAHQSENGFLNSTYMMFPVWGETDDSYDFKVVSGYDDHTAMGADWERMGNGGHWMKQQELLAGLIKCDSPRVYDARFVRDWAGSD